MAIFTIYFDASGSPDNSPALSVAGFIAETEQWIEFERNWNDALRAYGVSEMHMKNFGPGAGEFAPWKTDQGRRRRFLERLICIIKTRVRNSFVNCIMLEDYRKIDKTFALSEHNKPYALAGSCCIDKVRRWAKKRNINEREIAYFFEDGDKDKGSLIRTAERDHGITLNFRKKKESVAFQAADMLAYEHRLANIRVYESGIGTIALEELRKSLIALDAIPHEDSDWGVYDFESLEKQCIMNHYPRRTA